jgi:hypothetical protein
MPIASEFYTSTYLLGNRPQCFQGDYLLAPSVVQTGAGFQLSLRLLIVVLPVKMQVIAYYRASRGSLGIADFGMGRVVRVRSIEGKVVEDELAA